MTIPKPGDELTLRNGWPAKVLAVHPGQEWPIIGEFFNEHIHQWQSANWNKVGDNSRFPAFDLILPEPERLVLKGWVNVYPGCLQGPFKSEDSARTHRQPLFAPNASTSTAPTRKEKGYEQQTVDVLARSARDVHRSNSR